VHVTVFVWGPVENNRVFRNARYGLVLAARPWVQSSHGRFTGYVAGRGNYIPGPEGGDGNECQASFLDQLQFLASVHGPGKL